MASRPSISDLLRASAYQEVSRKRRKNPSYLELDSEDENDFLKGHTAFTQSTELRKLSRGAPTASSLNSTIAPDNSLNSAMAPAYPTQGRPSFSPASGGFVTFNIGAGDKIDPFVVHFEHVCMYSPVLKAAFEGSFIEGQTKTYNMAHVEPYTFQLFVRWLYTQSLELEAQYHKGYNGTITYTGKPKFDRESWFNDQVKGVVKLWVLAQELLIPRLQDQVMQYLFTLKDYTPWPLSREAAYVYENTSSPSPLRRLLVHVGTYCVATDEHERVAQLHKLEYPQEFVQDLMLACHRKLQHSDLSEVLHISNFTVENKKTPT